MEWRAALSSAAIRGRRRSSPGASRVSLRRWRVVNRFNVSRKLRSVRATAGLVVNGAQWERLDYSYRPGPRLERSLDGLLRHSYHSVSWFIAAPRDPVLPGHVRERKGSSGPAVP